MPKSSWMLVCFLLGFAPPTPSYSSPVSFDQEQAITLSQSREWIRLLHYRKKLFSEWVSFADSPSFFFSPHGKHDPLQELIASVEAFQKDLKWGRSQLHPQCAFPLRFQFLNERLNLNIPKVPCPDLTEWRDNLRVDSVSFVYSSAYPNNPASIFGHTLLKLNRRSTNKLLDYAVTYAADGKPTGLGVIYVLSGLFGGYDGFFALDPYFQKVNEYSNADSRDLWEYELNLDSEQVERLVLHLWELYQNTTFDYFFLDENCSFHILALLEVAHWDWNLTHGFPTYALPADTVKRVLAQKDSVKAVHFHPSNRKSLIARLEVLSEEENEEWKAALDAQEPERLHSAPAAEALIAYLNYHKFDDGLTEEQDLLFRRTLLRRAQLPKNSAPPPEVPWAMNRPDLGHDPMLLGVSLIYEDSPAWVSVFRFRWGLHDLLESDLGYEPFSRVTFGDLELGYNWTDSSFRLERFGAIGVTSLFPLDQFDNRFSWTVSVDVDRMFDLPCRTCRGLRLEAGTGGSFQFGTDWMIAYGLGVAHIDWSGVLEKTLRFGPGVRSGGIFRIGPNVKVQLEGQWKIDVLQNQDQLARFEWHGGQSLRLSQHWQWQNKFLWLPWEDNPWLQVQTELDYFF